MCVTVIDVSNGWGSCEDRNVHVECIGIHFDGHVDVKSQVLQGMGGECQR